MEVQPAKSIVGEQVTVGFRRVWDARNQSYRGLLEMDGWERLADLRYGKEEAQNLAIGALAFGTTTAQRPLQVLKT